MGRSERRVSQFRNAVRKIPTTDDSRIHKTMCLRLNYFSNDFLAWFLYAINVPFVFTAGSVADAILNSIATTFIIEIDDLVFPVVKSENTGGYSKIPRWL